jgi:hypothetical protein
VTVGGDVYSADDDRITTCHRSGDYILTSDSYTIEISRGNFITIHEDYVTQND